MICRLFNFDMLRDRGEERYNTITITTGSWWHGGVWKARFQQSSSTHSGAGEKETQNMNVVGKNLSFWCISGLGTYLERCAVKFRSIFHPELLILKTKKNPLCKNNEKIRISVPMSYIALGHHSQIAMEPNSASSAMVWWPNSASSAMVWWPKLWWANSGK